MDGQDDAASQGGDIGVYNADTAFRSAALLASKGIPVVRLHGVHAGGTCTCSRTDCRTPGKHPSGGEGWQHRATRDEDIISSWFEKLEPVNIGVVLGRSGNVIDVEVDGPDAQAVLEDYGLDRIETPTYRASRGEHRLFRFDARLPDTSVVKVGALEVRIGGGGKASQSVAPGSLHASGVLYSWLPGKSIDDVDIALMPERFLQAVLDNSGKRDSGVVAKSRAATAAAEKIGPGGRHAYLLGVASNQLFQATVLDEQCRLEVLNIVRSLNTTMCSPPKADYECERMVNDQLSFYQRARDAQLRDLRSTEENAVARLEAARHPWERLGLKREDGAWQPGEWQVVRVHSDPVRFGLRIPREGSANPFVVNLKADEWHNSKKVAARILEATGGLNVNDPTPNEWKIHWEGADRRNEQIRGISAQLFDPPYASDEYPQPEMIRSAIVASLLLRRLSEPPKDSADEKSKPAQSGSAKWVIHEKNPELWFNWTTVWGEINEGANPRVETGEQQDVNDALLAALNEKKWLTTQPRAGNPTRIRFLRWSDRHLDALARLADGERGAA